MKLSISNIGWPSELDNYMYEYLNEKEFEGIEIAPTKIFPVNPYENISAAEIFANELKKKYGLIISSMQSIWYGKTENIFDSECERRELVDYTKKAIDFASIMHCNNVVFGCPKNRNIDDISKLSIALRFFEEIGEYAKYKNTVIAIEPNPTIYNTNFINETSQAFDVVKKVASGGFKVNIDTGTIIQNSESLAVIEENISLINHIHVSEPFLEKIEKRDLHSNLSRLLSENHYNGFISIEMKDLNNLDIIKSTIEYVKEVFA